MVLMIPVLVAGLAFGAEVGSWELQRRKLQNAADMAAYAAATQVRSGVSDADKLKAFAKAVAEKGGYVAGDAGVTLSTPPGSGAYAGNVAAVQVSLDHSIARNFTGIFASGPIEFTVSATALVENGRPACVLALSRTAPKALNFSGATNVKLEGCDITSNSIASDAVNVNGASAAVETDCVSAVGMVSDAHGGIEYEVCAGPLENMPLTKDPYEGLAEPAAELAQPCASTAEEKKWNKSKGVGQPSPGRYCGGQHVAGEVSLSPGIYVLDGGDWRFNAASKVTGMGVSLFITGGATLTINGGAEFNIEAMDTGPLAGIAIFFDRDDAGITHTMNGGSKQSLTGVVYAPSADLKVNGGTSSGKGGPGCTQVVANTIEFNGNADFKSVCDWNGKKQIKTAQAIRIVE
jgi:Flp pilus assembly protein TadG